MSRTLFRQIPTGSRLLAIGNFFREGKPGAPWRMAAHFERAGQSELQRFGAELSCVLGVGREYLSETNIPYRSRGFRQTLRLPSVDGWEERPLGECPRLARRLAQNPEIAGQQCFVFEVGGVSVWLPKFELARKLFFHAAFLVRTAFEPSGLDGAFTVFKEGEVFHAYTPEKTGAPVELLKIKAYRDLFSWLLFEPDVRCSFESISRHLNDEQPKSGSGYIRWRFNFVPPASIVDVVMDAQGVFDAGSAEFLVWEITRLSGLKFSHKGDIYFHHPELKRTTQGKGGGYMPTASPHSIIEVDADDEPDEARVQQLILLPVEGISFDGELSTRVAYNGERARGRGMKVDDEKIPGGDETVYGVADAVNGGTQTPGEFQQLGDDSHNDLHAARFNLLRDLIKEIAEEPGLKLLQLDVKPLPKVPRCGYHLMDDGLPRCYLIACFQLRSGTERYLLEVDTSDNRRPLSTRIMGFKAKFDAKKCLEYLLQQTIKGSLRWPPDMAKLCDDLHSVHHPKEGTSDDYQARVDSWKQRIKACLI